MGAAQRLAGKIAIVTGAAGGIGKEHAKRFADEGASVVALDIDEQGAESTAKELPAGGDQRHLGGRVDISSLASCQDAADRVVAEFGRIDALVNNAAIYANIDHKRADEEYLDQVLSVNMLGPWRMSKAVVPAMMSQNSGRIINQSSDAALMYHVSRKPETLPNFAYAWSKYSVNGLTKFMAGVLGGYNITVNCISPGMTMTEATQQAVSPRMAERLNASTPLGRAMEPQEIAAAALFLASDDAKGITGQILYVNGGAVMP
ncbi:3-oxoacyl-[acyl-carrier protein] reductase [Amycolatopsis bartoniae]|uniref:Short-chain dehydrogenase n=1 Tax=Amycolatopsis bartoniae TaxID=941986 RepID=A0A8H9M7S8_9PSEU|nr:SDR family NAD(P)-dependent oxidoreductase [Amycolatopsis bartoniae]MBB2939916.1 3-oxoacyl-[acyl-carrier protein] reductase [Amycolatopsis bartoniae]GHF35698.1 short-chain dehydrogenase [Amycolatopsis bartoniae]